ncbi:carbohydrate ABC transporter permease [Paenibacillus sp. FSL R7-0331]|uniref:carbohydrate ABC transporter permease n=1 Tax=Paenibacillus sp. FSL R7-0331 TaxID=1536773 RepID=UPI0004F82BC6|nr:carbohydrate ABC transporter permease [Paenibacillus sp. FSL R7-0331]AIQ51277.1 ABC transporter permease [Paenibacillus sp. FSL R7-0331]
MNSPVRLGRWGRRALLYIIMVLSSLVMLYPILWMVSSSFKNSSEIFVNAHRLIPADFTLRNYVEGYNGFSGHTFTVFFKNSFIITLASLAGTLASSTLVAYGFARIRFRGSALLFAVMLVTMMLPGEVLTIPQYIMFQKLGWVNTFAPLIFPSFFGGAFFIFLLVQFIRGLPAELDESAKIDGCGHPGILFRILLPLLVPPLVTAAIFKFYWTWDDFFSPLLYLTKPELATVSLAVKNMSDNSFGTNWGAVFAMSVLSLLPVLLIFFLCQRYIIEGISTTGLKG